MSLLPLVDHTCRASRAIRRGGRTPRNEALGLGMAREPAQPGQQAVTPEHDSRSPRYRLFQARPIGPPSDPAAELATAQTPAPPGESGANPDRESLVKDSLAIWRRLAARPHVRSVLSAGQALYEVPFSMVKGQGSARSILRGVIDCLVQKDNGSVVVVEFKTGRPSPAPAPARPVVEAAKALYPDYLVEGC